MTGLQTTASSSDARALDPRLDGEAAGSASIASRTARVISRSPPGFIMA
jgi:hypothetical protein